MSDVGPSQTTAIIESVGEAIARVTTAPPVAVPEEPWWQIFAIVGGTIAALLTALGSYLAVKNRKKKP